MSRTPTDGFIGIYLAAAGRLSADFRQAAGYTHRVVSGDATADALMKWLEEQMPRRFSVVTGEVIDSTSKRSGQCDILLIDALNSPTILGSGRTGLYPFYGIAARIEVTQTLDYGKRSKDFKKIVDFRGMHDGMEYSSDFIDSAPLGYMFAEKSAVPLNSHASWLAKQCRQFKTPEERRRLPNGVVVLSQGILLYYDENKLVTSDPVNATGIVGIPNPEICLFVWLLFMMPKLRVLLEHRIRANTRRIWAARLNRKGWPRAEWIQAAGGEPYFQDLPTDQLQQHLHKQGNLLLIEL